MPLAPPRMLPSLGFVDTMTVFGPSAYSGDAATVSNQFAAMPSLHVGWALLIAVVVIRTANSRWRWATIAHPVLTTLVVVVTANHYWIDAVVSALLLGLVDADHPAPGRHPAVAALGPAGRAGRSLRVDWAHPRAGDKGGIVTDPVDRDGSARPPATDHGRP